MFGLVSPIDTWVPLGSSRNQNKNIVAGSLRNTCVTYTVVSCSCTPCAYAQVSHEVHAAILRISRPQDSRMENPLWPKYILA